MQANGVHTLSKYQRLNELGEIGRWFDPNRRSHLQGLDLQWIEAFFVGVGGGGVSNLRDLKCDACG
jgi:hypothetical protein